MFAVLNYLRPDKNQCQYVLEGFDNNWYPAKLGQPTVYTNLAPKTYQLRVKAINNDGVMSEEETVLTIIKKPSFWQTGSEFFLHPEQQEPLQEQQRRMLQAQESE